MKRNHKSPKKARFILGKEAEAELAESDKQDENARKALQCLLGIEEEPAKKYWGLHENFRWKRDDANSALARLFSSEKINYASQAEKAEKGIKDYLKSIDLIKEDHVARIVLGREFTHDELVSAVIAAGVEVNGEWYEIEEGFKLEEVTISFANEMDRMQSDSPLTPLETLLGSIRKLARDEPTAIPYFLDDFMQTLGVRSDYFNAMIADGMPISEHGTEQNNYGVAARGLITNAEESAPVIEEMIASLPDYRTIAKSHLLEAAGNWAELSDKTQIIRNIAIQIRNLVTEGINERDLGNLVLSASSNQQEELFGIIAGNPEYGKFWIREKRHQVAASSYAAFLLNYADAVMPSGKENCFEFLKRVAATKGHAASTSVLVSASYAWMLDENFGGLFETLANHQSGEEILKKYLQYGEQGAANKQKFLKELSVLPFEVRTFKQDILVFDYLTDEQVGTIINDPDFNLQLREFAAKLKPGPVKSHPATAEKKNWIDVMKHEHREMEASLHEAYGILQERGLEDRLRNIWRTQPGILARFAQDIIAYKELPLLFEALQNNSLYSKIKEWQHAHPKESLGGILEAIASNENKYAALQEAFGTEKTETAATGSPKVAAANHEESIRRISLKKVIIWSDTYTTEMQRRIEEELMQQSITPVFYDRFKRAKYASIDADAVLWTTPYSEHSGYYAVKNTCSKNGVPFFHVNRPGADAVISFIRQIAA